MSKYSIRYSVKNLPGVRIYMRTYIHKYTYTHINAYVEDQRRHEAPFWAAKFVSVLNRIR